MKILILAALSLTFAPGIDERPNLELINDLLKATAKVESDNNTYAFAEGEDAHGLYQIRLIMIDDVNRIVGRKIFNIQDAYTPATAEAIWFIYSMHYARHTDDFTVEGIARRWNGGPTGHANASTEFYWDKMEYQLGKFSEPFKPEPR